MKTNAKPAGRQAHWLTHVERARALKMPLAQYCRARGLNVQSLYNVRHELSAKVRRADVSSSSPKKTTHPFIAVELASPTPSGSACRIQLRDVVIECAGLPEPAWLWALSRGAGDVVP